MQRIKNVLLAGPKMPSLAQIDIVTVPD
jgi:hypothetical protein